MLIANPIMDVRLIPSLMPVGAERWEPSKKKFRRVWGPIDGAARYLAHIRRSISDLTSLRGYPDTTKIRSHRLGRFSARSPALSPS